MRNMVKEGRVITMAAPADVASGDGVVVGGLFGVATSAAASGADVELLTQGVVSLPKVASSVSAGVLLYWDNTNKRATTVAAGNRPIGFHAGKVANAGAVDTPILVLLAPAAIVTPS
jgi:predicted RecA/RadA family phage recombinase